MFCKYFSRFSGAGREFRVLVSTINVIFFSLNFFINNKSIVLKVVFFVSSSTCSVQWKRFFRLILAPILSLNRTTIVTE